MFFDSTLDRAHRALPASLQWECEDVVVIGPDQALYFFINNSSMLEFLLHVLVLKLLLQSSN